MPIKGQRYFSPLPSSRPGRKTSRPYASIVAKIRDQRGPFSWRSARLPNTKLLRQLAREGELKIVHKGSLGRYGNPTIYQLSVHHIPPQTRTDLL